MRTSLLNMLVLLAASPAVAAAAPQASEKVDLLAPHYGLMFWTLILFVLLLFVLKRYAFGPILAAVEAREQALAGAIEAAKRDREESARLLAEQQKQIEGARAEAQRLIAEGRAVGERLRTELVEQARAEQQAAIERARREIETEKTRAIAELRREAVDLAIAGAARVIEKNLDAPQNRKLVEDFLATAGVSVAKR